MLGGITTRTVVHVQQYTHISTRSLVHVHLVHVHQYTHISIRTVIHVHQYTCTRARTRGGGMTTIVTPCIISLSRRGQYQETYCMVYECVFVRMDDCTFHCMYVFIILCTTVCIAACMQLSMPVALLVQAGGVSLRKNNPCCIYVCLYVRTYVCMRNTPFVCLCLYHCPYQCMYHSMHVYMNVRSHIGSSRRNIRNKCRVYACTPDCMYFQISACIVVCFTSSMLLYECPQPSWIKPEESFSEKNRACVMYGCTYVCTYACTSHKMRRCPRPGYIRTRFSGVARFIKIKSDVGRMGE